MCIIVWYTTQDKEINRLICWPSYFRGEEWKRFICTLQISRDFTPRLATKNVNLCRSIGTHDVAGRRLATSWVHYTTSCNVLGQNSKNVPSNETDRVQAVSPTFLVPSILNTYPQPRTLVQPNTHPQSEPPPGGGWSEMSMGTRIIDLWLPQVCVANNVAKYGEWYQQLLAFNEYSD